jgi:vacuolar-type H+-ATPase subunit I/STV1
LTKYGKEFEAFGGTMAGALLELYELFEKKLGKEEAKEAIELVGKAIEAIREEAKAQKPILKAEIREELRKELATKEDIAIVRQEIQTVRQEIQTVRQEIETVYRELNQKIETVRQELKGEMKVLRILIYVTLTAVILMNKGTIEYLINLIKMIK